LTLPFLSCARPCKTKGGQGVKQLWVEVIKMRLINMTPHDVNIATPNGAITVPKSGVVVRLEEHDEPFTLNPISIVRRKFQTPDPTWVAEQAAQVEGVTLSDAPSITIALVSLPLLMAMPADALSFLASKNIVLAAPDTGKGAIRDEKGQIVAVRGLVTK
jgi:hypothetical protein